MFKELQTDLGIPPLVSGNLERWAVQGVLLLNASLTVEQGKPMSHSNLGWHLFTDAVIRYLSAHREGIVFMLWGKFAQNKASLIDSSRHCVLKAAHPSPLSAYNGFFGCRHFSKANEWLLARGKAEIVW
jgi:uracil-DNA glycosylase